MTPRTPHTCTRHDPGDRACYIGHSCRCRRCTDAATRWQRHQKWLRENGQRRTVDAAPVRQHLERLGLTPAEVEARTGVPRGTVYNIIYGRSQRTSPNTAQRLMRLTRASAAVHTWRTHGLVDSTGTARRLQALAIAGWPCSELGRRLNLTASRVEALRRGITERVEAATAARVATLYDQLWNQAPPYRSQRTINTATRRGWQPALAWDDDEIDNPDARPHLGEGPNVWGSPLENVEWLAEAGEKLPGIARQLGKTKDSIKTLLWRHGRTSLLTKITPDLNPIRGDNTTKGRAA